MDFSEVVGFIVTMVAVFLMFFKKSPRNEDHSHVDEDESSSQTLEEFLKSIEEDMDASKDFAKHKEVKAKVKPKEGKFTAPLKAKTVNRDFSFETKMDSFKSESSIEKRKLNLGIKEPADKFSGEYLLSAEFRIKPKDLQIKERDKVKGAKIIRNLPSKKDMIILNEVLKSPKGMQF